MKKDANSMKEVAARCSHYSPFACSTCNSTGSNVTCLNCKHYSEEEVCDLHLYEDILESHNI